MTSPGSLKKALAFMWATSREAQSMKWRIQTIQSLRERMKIIKLVVLLKQNISLAILRVIGALSSHSFGFDRAIRIATLPSVVVL